MMHLAAPADMSASKLNDLLEGGNDYDPVPLMTSNAEGAAEYARERAKAEGVDWRVYKLVETHYFKGANADAGQSG